MLRVAFRTTFRFETRNWVHTLRGRTPTQRSQKGPEKVLGRVLGKGSQKGSEKGAFFYGFYSKKGFREGFSEGVLRGGFPEGAQNAPLRSTPLRRAPSRKFPGHLKGFVLETCQLIISFLTMLLEAFEHVWS